MGTDTSVIGRPAPDVDKTQVQKPNLWHPPPRGLREAASCDYARAGLFGTTLRTSKPRPYNWAEGFSTMTAIFRWEWMTDE
jgi:hypothetical protein